MLSVMRRHVGWGLKVILGVVIVSFVFFFGYTTIQQQQNSDQVALEVGNEDIPYSRYQFIYDQQYENFAQKFKGGEMPEFVLNSIRQTAQRLLVQRSLTGQFAKQLGLQIGDSELAAFITKEKDFDPVQYKNFLEYFYRQNGFSYEDIVREDLLLQQFQAWAQKIAPVTPSPLANIQWTFETLTLTGKEKKGLAEKIQTAWAKGEKATALVKQTKVDVKKVGPIGFEQRQSLFQKELTEQEYLSLFSLSKTATAPSQPYAKGESFLLIRVTDLQGWNKIKTEPTSLQPKANLVDVWFQKFANQTEVESHIPSESQ